MGDALNDPHNQIHGLVDLIEYAKPTSVLEIGSNVGVSTETFLLHCPVTAVDIWPSEDEYKRFCERCCKYPNLTIIRGKSPDVVRQIKDQFDLVYIDADHSRLSVRADLEASFPLVKRWLAGHDYNLSGVFLSVNEMLGNPDKVFSDQSWIIRKQ